jgi:ATP-dependent DNA helicase RecQ
MMTPNLEEALRTRFQLEAFRPWQKEAILPLLAGAETPMGARVLVVAPTGGGKSLTYQLPAILLPGTTLVISPLVALMEDQVRSLTARGIEATYLASTLASEERHRRENAFARGEYKLVYCAPERLASDAFVNLLTRARISLVAIDEAHCIAHWGHDFRPDYLRIGTLLERLRPPRVLACTATATPEVRREIRERLSLDPCVEVLRGFARPNLHLEARHVDGPKDARLALNEIFVEALGKASAPKGGAIVYAATRKATEQWAEHLRKAGWNAAHYHAGIDAATRTRTSQSFADKKTDVVVATNAFGMGIDRDDIRVVVHVQPPSSIEAYYQEVGRAGRDGKEAYGLLLCSGSDIALRRRFSQMGTDGADPDPKEAARAWALFRELLLYLDARTCRHDFILRYFGDEQETLGGCGHCDVCAALDEAGAAGGSAAAAGPESTGPETTARAEDAEAAALIVRKALSGVARAQRRAGLVAIAEMLYGVDSERMRKFGFTQLSTFGILALHSHDWIIALLRGLLAAGWIDLTPNEHPVPFVTATGREVMAGRAPARLALPPLHQKKSRARPLRDRSAAKETVIAASLRPVFERLRAHRAEVAKARGVPAYVVAHDRTLVDLAENPPRTREELLGIRGFGPARVDAYGAGFLAVLAHRGDS